MALRRNQAVHDQLHRHRHVQQKVCRKSHPSLSPIISSILPSIVVPTPSQIPSFLSQTGGRSKLATLAVVTSAKASATPFTSPSTVASSSSSNCNALATPISVPGFKFAGKDCFLPFQGVAEPYALDIKFFPEATLTELLHHCADFCLSFGDSCGQYFVNILSKGCFPYFPSKGEG